LLCKYEGELIACDGKGSPQHGIKEGGSQLKGYIEERAIEVAHFIIEHKSTVRATAKKFGISKSTVHKDVAERLLYIRPELAKLVREILDENKAERHIRGGQATKAKYNSNTNI
jgi:putative DeoR family transcriptional regulator (stage III sporulation protein D)